MKVCRGCGLAKDLDRFTLNKANLDGHVTLCKDCINKARSNGKGKGHRLQSVDAGFWKRIVKGESPDQCWSWVGSTAHGYGDFTANRKHHLAHRHSWLIHYGVIPVGLFVLHRCDNPRCCNPNHLFLGTQKDNIYDAYSKGRMVSIGTLTRKVSLADEMEIVVLRRSGMPFTKIGARFNITREAAKHAYLRGEKLHEENYR